ncbi:MAG: FAM72 protein-domain-containing protein, partial [Benniella sp.]
MPLYPPSQYQHYANGALNTTASNDHGGLGIGSTRYRRAENIIRYGSSLRNRYRGPSNSNNGRIHSKTVYRIDCRYCSAVICLRGMKAMLLADTSIELFSTDYPPGAVQLIDQDYATSNCRCRIRDVACRICGNVVGYHITQPCQDCLKAPNNGHFWMFHADGVTGQERL